MNGSKSSTFSQRRETSDWDSELLRLDFSISALQLKLHAIQTC